MQNIGLILSSVFFTSIAQIFIRQGMIRFGDVSISFNHIGKMIINIFSNIYLFAGIVCFGASVILWMITLSKVNVSIAYPFTSLGYVLVAILSYFIFNEPLTVQKIIGILIICLGVVVLSYSKDFV